MSKKYRLKKEVGGYLALTTPGFECIMRKDDEVELTAEQLARVKDYVELVPKAPKKRVKKETKTLEDNE